jgi:peptidoglycan/xylan/chitin deacetylase (PgdA/CDA1 family)
VPVGALFLGSWLGLSAPSTAAPTFRSTWSDGARASEEVTADLAASPPGESATTSVEASLLPDPVPWPRLNSSISVKKAWLLAEGPAPEKGDGRRLVTLTFDDGPFPRTTPPLLKVLERYDVKATFFLVGGLLDGDAPFASATREAAKRIAAAGHIIGNHTHDHFLLTRVTHNQAQAQIDDGADSIERVTGKRPIFFRPPYGQLDPFAEDVLRQRGAELVLWNIEADNADNDDPAAIAESIENHLEYAGGGIVLLHDIRRSTAPTVAKLLAWLRSRRFDPARPERIGFQVVDLPTYLQATAAHPQPYGDRTALEEARGVEWRHAHPSLPAF